MGKSEQNSTFEHRRSGDLLAKLIVDARVNTRKNIIMVDCVESNDGLMDVCVTDGDVGGATRHMPPSTDMVVKATDMVVSEDDMQPATDVVVKTTDVMVKTTDAVVKTTDMVVKTTDAVVKTTDAVVKTTDAVVKTTDAVVKTTDMVVKEGSNCGDASSFQTVSEFQNGNGNAPQRSPPHDQASENLEKTSNENMCPIDELTRPPLKSVHRVPPVVDGVTLQVSPQVAVPFTEQITERRVTTDTGDMCGLSSSVTDIASGNRELRMTLGVESESVRKSLGETEDGSVDRNVIVSVTSQDECNVTVDSDAVSVCDTVVESSCNEVVITQSGDALQTSHSSSVTTSVSTLTCSVTKSPDTPSVSSCTHDIVNTTSGTVDMSPANDSPHVPQTSVTGDSVIHSVGSDDVNMTPNCDHDKSSMECVNHDSVNSDNVNTEAVDSEIVTSESINTESVSIEVDSFNTVGDSLSQDNYHNHIAQNISASSQSDTEDAVSSHVTETAVPMDTGDTGNVAVTHVITPICDTPVSLPAVSPACANMITVVAPVSDSANGTIAQNVTPASYDDVRADVTGSVAITAGNIPDESGNCVMGLTSDQHGPDVVISSSKITKRKHVGSEAIVVKREKLDTSYDAATAGSNGQVNRGVAQVGRGVHNLMTQPLTVNPVRAPHLARHLLQNTTGKESRSRPGRPPVKTVTLRMLPPGGGRGSAMVSGGTARLAYPANSMWKHAQTAAGSKSDTCVIMAPSVGSIAVASAVTAVPFNAVACPYVLVSSAPTSIVQSQFSQAQPAKLQTVTILPASSAPRGGRMRQVTVSCVTGGVNKALSRPESVPIYKCPAPPAGLFDGDPPKTFTCCECLDTFWHERSLRQHLNRKSVSIRIHCTTCRTQLLFYNHCAFLLHMHSHRAGSLDTFGLHRAKVAPLPQHFMPAVYWSVCSKDSRSLPTSVTPQTTESAAVATHADVASQPLLVVDECGEKSAPPKTRFQCTECRSAYTSQGQLQHHLAVKVGQRLYHCDRCTMVMRNPCRYRAHVRVHMKQRPYVCPECGELVPGDHAVFLKHVKWRCLHFTRTVRFTCTEHECNRHFDTSAGYVNHVVAEHASNYYKCLSCPMAFRVKDAFEKHNTTVHTSTAVSQHIIKCGYCDTVYQRHADLTAHMTKNHEAALCGLMHYVFKCPQCKYVRATKYDLIKHMETTHAFKYMLSMCNMCGEEMAGRLLEAHKSECHPHSRAVNTNEPFPWQCSQCSQSFPSAAKLLKHQRIHNGTIRALRLHKSHDNDKSSDEANSETNCEYVEPTLEFSCSMCSDTYSEQSELTHHLQVKHGIVPQFPCHLCGLTYANDADTKRHIADVHEGKKVVSQPTFTCWLCDDDDAVSRHFKKRRGLVNHLATVHRIPKNNIDLARLSSSLSDSSSTEGATEAATAVKRLKTDVDAKFVCAKCDFSGVDRAAFVAHIAKHRTRDSPWQCHECALCFTARPSLRRHLFMVHRVRDFERYNKDAGVDLDVPLVDVKDEEEDDELVFGTGTFVRPIVPPPAPMVVSPPTSDNPLECTVCYKQFDDENAKRVHMRTHGMAFIYSRRRATKPVQ